MRTLTLAAALAFASCSSSKAPAPASVDSEIEYYTKRVAENPRLYPVWAQLGDAYLDRAKETSEASFIVKAHEAADKSLALQETFHAYHLKARLYGHAHHFEDALVWIAKAKTATVFPNDPMLMALEVEMLIGAGRLAEAKARLPSEDSKPDSFYVAAALARVANAEHQFDIAAKHYKTAADFARAENARPLVAWAEAMAGGMLLDGGNFTAAEAHLDASRRFGGCAEQAIHRAELLAGTGKQREALAAYQAYLANTPDPAVHHAAWRLAKAMKDETAAKKHFTAAGAGYRKVIAAGEVYTLGGLAQLLLDAGGDPHEALKLAEQNFTYKRDGEAKATLDEARRRVEPKG